MSEKPCGASESGPLADEGRVVTRGELRSVARMQRGLILCIVIHLAGPITVASRAGDDTRVLWGFLVLILICGAFVTALGIKIYGRGVGLFCGVMTLVPILGLGVLLGVNGKATKLLRAHGIRVGPFGAEDA